MPCVFVKLAETSENRSQERHLDHQVRWQTSLLTEPPHQPLLGPLGFSAYSSHVLRIQTWVLTSGP